MNMVKYIGLDVHRASISIATLNVAGKLMMEATVEMRAAALVDFLAALRSTRHVALEEGTYAEGLYELWSQQMAEVMVCDARQ